MSEELRNFSSRLWLEFRKSFCGASKQCSRMKVNLIYAIISVHRVIPLERGPEWLNSFHNTLPFQLLHSPEVFAVLEAS